MTTPFLGNQILQRHMRSGSFPFSGGKEKEMFIPRQTKKGIVWVEIYENYDGLLQEEARLMNNENSRYGYWAPVKTGSLTYEGMQYGYTDSPETILLRKERDIHIWETMKMLSDKQFRRLIMWAIDELSYTEIAKIEECDVTSIIESINSAIIKFKKFY